MFVFHYNGMKLPVAYLFDIYGDPTHDPEEATSLVARLPSGEWLACTCWPQEIECAAATAGASEKVH